MGGPARRRLVPWAAAALAFGSWATAAHATRLVPAGPGSPAGVTWAYGSVRAGVDSLSGAEPWRARLADPATAPTALHVLADLRFASGDATGADSCWRILAARRGPWQAGAALSLAADLEARSGPAVADSVLGAVQLIDGADAEEATLLERLSALRAAARDAVDAEAAARLVVRSYPAVPAVAARALARLDSLRASRGDSLATEDLRAGAEVDVFRGARSSAIARLRRAQARSTGAARFGATLRLSQVLRDARMPRTAGVAAQAALALASTPAQRQAAELEKARALRSAGATDSALALYAGLGRGTGDGEFRDVAWWEYAREAEDRGRYRDALEGFSRCSQLGGRRAEDARFQAGLMRYVLGAPDSACAWWRRAHGENARFWLGVGLRSTDRAASDSILWEVARAPGFGFYRAAARESLEAAGRGGLAPGEAADSLRVRLAALRRLEAGADFVRPATEGTLLADARALLAGGRDGDATALLSLVLARDPRAPLEPERTPASILGAASLSFDGGLLPLATRLADAAFAAARVDSEAWAVVAWAYPPAFETEVVGSESPEVGRSLLWALVRQESRFDPRARSRSDALGLTQLMLPAARDMAAAFREAPPTEAALFEPARAIRYGARYLGGLLRRFENSVPVALVAYNSGPATVRPDWRELLSRGGDALFCELASNADSQDYAKRIEGFRRAYRVLQPTAKPR